MAGTSGIGLAARRFCCAKKFKVTISGRDPQRLARATQKLRNEVGRRRRRRYECGFGCRTVWQPGWLRFISYSLSAQQGTRALYTVSIEDLRSASPKRSSRSFACAQAPQVPEQRAASPFYPRSRRRRNAGSPAGYRVGQRAIAALVPTLARDCNRSGQPWRQASSIHPGGTGSHPTEGCTLCRFISKTRSAAWETRGNRPGDHLPRYEQFMTGQTIICDGGIRLFLGPD